MGTILIKSKCGQKLDIRFRKLSDNRGYNITDKTIELKPDEEIEIQYRDYDKGEKCYISFNTSPKGM